jgi:molybdopterin converting factor small subunit
MKDKDMKVEVNLYANLRQYSPTKETSFKLDLACGSTVSNLINTLKIPQNIKMVVLINGRHADADTHLSSEDKIVLFPPVEGG